MKIWDRPTRLYHWLQAGLFTLLLITGLSGNGPHELLGMALSTLLLWRVLWGIKGSETSRFRQFVRSPKTVIRYIRGNHQHHGIGHNPAGGWMVMIMLIFLAGQCFVGMAMAGFFDAFIHDESILFDTDLLVSLHIIGAYVLIGTVLMHVTAILIYKHRGKPLVNAMITGKQSNLRNNITVFFRSDWRAGILLASVSWMISLLFSQ